MPRSWWTKLFPGVRRAKPVTKRPVARPKLVALEDRATPATVTFAGGELTIVYDTLDESVTVTATALNMLGGTDVTVASTDGVNGDLPPYSNVTKITVVNDLAGTETLTLDAAVTVPGFDLDNGFSAIGVDIVASNATIDASGGAGGIEFVGGGVSFAPGTKLSTDSGAVSVTTTAVGLEPRDIVTNAGGSVSLTAAGLLNQVVGTSIVTPGVLKVTGPGAILLREANAVGTLVASAGLAGGGFRMNNTQTLRVGSVIAPAVFLTTTAGDIIRANDSSFIMTDPIRLEAAGLVDVAILPNSPNGAFVAGKAGTTFSVSSTDRLTVSTIDGMAGIEAPDGVTLKAGSDLAVDAGITVTAANGAIDLKIGNDGSTVGRVATLPANVLFSTKGTTVTGGNGPDTFNIFGSADSTIAVVGGLPTTIPGDTLNLLDSGDYTFGPASTTPPGGGQEITFSGIETVASPNADSYTFLGTAAADAGVLRQEADGPRFTLNGQAFRLVPNKAFLFDGKGAGDSLTVDYRGATPLQITDITFDGGTSDGEEDLLWALGAGPGGPFRFSARYTTESAGKGKFEIANNPDVNPTDYDGMVRFQNLTPVNISGMGVVVVVEASGAAAIELVNGPSFLPVPATPIDSIIVRDQNLMAPAFEQVAVWNTPLLVVQTSAGPRTVSVNIPASTSVQSVTIAGDDDDTIAIDGGVTLTGNFNVAANAIEATANVSVVGQVTYFGVGPDSRISVSDANTTAGQIIYLEAESLTLTSTETTTTAGGPILIVGKTVSLADADTTTEAGGGIVIFGDTSVSLTDSDTTALAAGDIQILGETVALTNSDAITKGSGTVGFSALTLELTDSDLRAEGGGDVLLFGSSVTLTNARAFSAGSFSTIAFVGTGANSVVELNDGSDVASEGVVVFDTPAVDGSLRLGPVAVSGRVGVVQVGAAKVTLTGGDGTNATTLTSTEGNITLAGTVNGTVAGEESLVATAPLGTTKLSSSVGDVTALKSLTLNTPGEPSTIILDGAEYITTDGQTYNGPTTVAAAGGPIAFDSTNGPITFNGTLDAAVADSTDITVTSGAGGIAFHGEVGGTTRPESLTTSTTGATTLSQITVNQNISITTGGSLSVSQPLLSVNGNVSLTADRDITLVALAGGVPTIEAASGTIALQIGNDMTTNGATATLPTDALVSAGGATVTGGNGPDTFNVGGSGFSKIAVVGGLPTSPPGDVLNLTDAAVITFEAGSPPSAVSTFPVGSPPPLIKQPISYTQIETVRVPNALNVVVNGSDLDDVGILREVDDGGVSRPQFTLNDNPPILLPNGAPFTFNGKAGQDTLVVDLGTGGAISAGPVTFDGTDAAGDLLWVTAGTGIHQYGFDARYTATGQGEGTVAVTRHQPPIPDGYTLNISFENLTPVTIDGMGQTTFVNLSNVFDTSVVNGMTFLPLPDPAVPAVIVRPTVGNGFEMLAVFNTPELVISTNDGEVFPFADIVRVAIPTNDHSVLSVRIDGDSTDRVIVSGGATLTDNFTAGAGKIEVNANVDVGGNVTYTGVGDKSTIIVADNVATTAGGTISYTAADEISVGADTLTSTVGNVTYGAGNTIAVGANSTTSAGGNVAYGAGDTITIGAGAVTAAGGSIDYGAGNAIVVGNGTTTEAMTGDVTYGADNTIDVGADSLTAAITGTVSYDAGSSIGVGDNSTTTAGMDVSYGTGTGDITIGAGATTSADGNVAYGAGSKIDVGANTVTSAGATITYTAGMSVGVGDDATTSAGMDVTYTAVDEIGVGARTNTTAGGNVSYDAGTSIGVGAESTTTATTGTVSYTAGTSISVGDDATTMAGMDISYDAETTITVGADTLTTAGKNVTYGAGASIDIGTSAETTAGGNIVFGAGTTINVGDNATTKAIGNVTETAATSITHGTNATTSADGNVTLIAPEITLNDGANVSAGGTITFDASMELKLGVLTVSGNAGVSQIGPKVTLTGGGTTVVESKGKDGFVTVQGDINGTDGGKESLIIDAKGSATLTGSVGNLIPLNELTVTGNGITLGGSKYVTVNDQKYNGNTVVTAPTVEFESKAESILFNGTLNDAAEGDLSSNVTATAKGTITFDGDVGGANDGLASLSTAKAVTTVFGSKANLAQTFGSQSYGTPVLMNGTGKMDFTSKDGAITFDKTLDGPRDVTVSTGGGTTFNGNVGVGTKLASLTVNPSTVPTKFGAKVEQVVTSGSQTYNPAVSVDGAGSTSFEAGDKITFQQAISGGRDVSVTTADGVTFNGNVGVPTPLNSLTTNGGRATFGINATQVITSKQQTYNTAVSFDNAGSVTTTFAAGGPVTFNQTVDGRRNVVVTTAALTTFNGAVGASDALQSLRTNGDGTTRINGSGIATIDNQIYDDAVVLGADVLFRSANPNNPGDKNQVGVGTIAFNSTLTSATDGGHAAIVNTFGLTQFNAPVGGGAGRLSFLGTDILLPPSTPSTAAGNVTQVNGGSIRTTGDQFYGDNVLVGGMGPVNFESGGGSITFFQTLNGGLDVTVNAPEITRFIGAVGGAAPLASLTTNAGGKTFVDTNLVRTSGAQTFNDKTFVTNGATFQSLGSTLTFNETLDGPGAVTLSAPGNTTLNRAVGGATPLGALTTMGGGTTRVNGGLVQTSVFQTYNDPVVIGNTSATFRSTVGGDLIFQSTLDATGPLGATLETGGNAGFAQPVGSTNLADLTVTAARIFANAGTITTTNDQSYTGLVVIGGSGKLTIPSARNVTFNSGVVASVGGELRQNQGSGTTTFTSGNVNVPFIDLTTGAIVSAANVDATAIRFNPQGGGVNQSGGQIVANKLILAGSGTFSLDQLGNQLTSTAEPLVADVTGPITLRVGGNLSFQTTPEGHPLPFVRTSGGAVIIYVGGNFSAIDNRSDYTIPLIDTTTDSNPKAGSVVIIGGLTPLPRPTDRYVFTYDAEIKSGSVQFGNDSNNPIRDGNLPTENLQPDTFRVRPSMFQTVVVFGNAPPFGTLPGDSITPITTGLTGITLVRNPDSKLGAGTYTATFPNAEPQQLQFFQIESFGSVSFQAAVVQTGARDYAIRVQLIQNSPLGSSITGQGVNSNAFVIAPAFVSITSPFGVPSIAVGDVNGDGVQDLIIANGPNDLPLVTVINGLRLFGATSILDFRLLNPQIDLIAQFFAFNDNSQNLQSPNRDTLFLGGLEVAVGDLNPGDGKRMAEIAVGARTGGAPRVQVFTYVGDPNGPNNPFNAVAEVASFFAFESTFRGGVHLAIGDIDRDGAGDLIVGAGSGGAARIKVFSGPQVIDGTVAQRGPDAPTIADFFAFAEDTNFRGGVLVAAGDFDGDGQADVMAAPASDGGPRIEIYGFNNPSSPQVLVNFFAFDPNSPAANTLLSPTNTGFGGIAFGATPTTNTADLRQDILYSTARGTSLQLVRLSRSGRPQSMGGADGTEFNAGGVPMFQFNFYDELTTLSQFAILDPLTRQPLDEQMLFDGGSVAGVFVDQVQG